MYLYTRESAIPVAHVSLLPHLRSHYSDGIQHLSPPPLFVSLSIPISAIGILSERQLEPDLDPSQSTHKEPGGGARATR